MCPLDGAQDAWHARFDELRGRPHPEHTGRAASQHRSPGLECLGLRHHMTAARDELAALSGELQVTTDPVEEANTELLLQITDLTRQRGLADVEAAAGERHAARVDDADEVAEMTKLHLNRCL